MVVASVAALIAVSPPSPLFFRRPSALAARPLFFPPRNSLAHRFPDFVFPARLPSLPRPKSRLAVPAAGDSDAFDIDLEIFGGDRASESLDDSAGGGGGGNGDGGDGESGLGGGNSEEMEKGEPDKEKKVDVGRMSMSQKLTLVYAALVGVHGIMDYFISGSQKSLAAGGIVASLLYCVCTLLKVRPAFASAVGLGLSSALLGMMGYRFVNSGKVLPAGILSPMSLVMSAEGILSLMSLVMSAVYFRGIIHSSHA